MSPQRQDYLLRMIEELGRFVAEIRALRGGGHYDAALLTGLQAQERLFARPAQEFMTRSAEDQVHLLAVGETDANAREKCLAFATLLTEAGHTYAAREQNAIASGAYQLALHVLLLTALRLPAPEAAEDDARIAALLDRLPAEDLAAQVRGLLEQFRGAGRNIRAPLSGTSGAT